LNGNFIQRHIQIWLALNCLAANLSKVTYLAFKVYINSSIPWYSIIL